MKKISYSKIGEIYGVSKQNVMKWVDAGHVPYEVDKHGRRVLYEETALPAIEEYMKHRKDVSPQEKKLGINDPKGFTTTSALNKAKAIREQYNAKMARLLYEQKLKELIKVDVVEKRLFELALQVRDSVLTIPGKISPELASMNDEREINIFLTKILTDCLEALSEGEFEKWRNRKLRK